ncbi:hypothetical protein K502DRAFT_368070 [Neoconidiobolus thromboides FSU 785]|nr:hypothetical protein K502DRAFT_368070 [Neoconidiobolus thromboides FSU 785]
MKFLLIALYTSQIFAALNHFNGKEEGEDSIDDSQVRSKLELNTSCNAICNENPSSANSMGCFCFTPNGQSQAQGVALPMNNNLPNTNANNRNLPIQPTLNNVNDANNANSANNANTPNANVATVVVFTTINPQNGQAMPLSTSTLLPGQTFLPTPSNNNQRNNKWMPALNNHPSIQQINKGWNSNTYFPTPSNKNFNALSSSSRQASLSTSMALSSASKAMSKASSSMSMSMKSMGNNTSGSSYNVSHGFSLIVLGAILALY